MPDHHNSPVARHLAKRVALNRAETPVVSFRHDFVPAGLLDYLRSFLAAGETHYTTRPGLTELRQMIGRELHRHGGPDRDADGVIVTQGEGEALYVTLLGLGIATESIVGVAGECRHLPLFDLLGLEVVGPDDPKAGNAAAFYGEMGDEQLVTPRLGGHVCFEILALGGLLYSERSRANALSCLSDRAILVGHLDSLPGLDHFRMAYVAGPPDLVKRIQTWKQALSICSAAPSQRAAVFAISRDRV